jgi:mannose-6-phosphate isomerase-like protein (cupin superfamily)
MEIIAGAGAYRAPASGSPNDYVPQFASKDLSVGTYSIPAGGVDDQSPHDEDEIYVVTAGKAVISCDSGSSPVGPGSVIFVPAGEGHRFVDIGEDLALLVFFAPPYGTRNRSAPPG